VFPRSSNKPMQAVGMLEAGLDLDGELLALACASHSGEAFHLDGVRRILAAAGLTEGALQTPPEYPVDEAEKLSYAAAGGGPTPLAMNCSGKHAAMLATCVANGWPTSTYADPDHPLQRGLRATVERLAGEPVAAVGVDGCGAPLFALTLTGLARAFAAIATAPAGTPEHRVATAIRAHPEWLGGTRRDVTRLIAGVPGLIAKDGAEGVYAAALPDGRVAALKVDDGGQRARPPVMVAALRALGVGAPVLDELAEAALLGGGEPVGAVRCVL
jgi:L-asparaginase II